MRRLWRQKSRHQLRHFVKDFQVKKNSEKKKTKDKIEEFAIYLNYCRSLRFEDRPDYNYLKRLFKDLFWRTYTEWDFLFDWVILNSVRREY